MKLTFVTRLVALAISACITLATPTNETLSGDATRQLRSMAQVQVMIVSRARPSLCVEYTGLYTNEWTLGYCNPEHYRQTLLYDPMAMIVSPPSGSSLCMYGVQGDPTQPPNAITNAACSVLGDTQFRATGTGQLTGSNLLKTMCVDQTTITMPLQKALGSVACSAATSQLFDIKLKSTMPLKAMSGILTGYPGAVFKIISNSPVTNQCLTYRAGSGLVTTTCSGVTQQQFQYNSFTLQLYLVFAQPTVLCLDTTGQPVGSRTWLWSTCNNFKAEHRFVYDTTTGQFRQPFKPTVCLSVVSGQVTTATCSATAAAQRFTLVKW